MLKVFATNFNYGNIFTIGGNSQESLFALHFYDGRYGLGSSRQIQFGRSKIWNGNMTVYGGGKGLTVTLFNSFNMQKDVRLKDKVQKTFGYSSELYSVYLSVL